MKDMIYLRPYRPGPVVLRFKYRYILVKDSSVDEHGASQIVGEVTVHKDDDGKDLLDDAWYNARMFAESPDMVIVLENLSDWLSGEDISILGLAQKSREILKNINGEE